MATNANGYWNAIPLPYQVSIKENEIQTTKILCPVKSRGNANWKTALLQFLRLVTITNSPGRYVSIIQSNIESGPKMIQFSIQFKTKFEIFIQSKIHSKISLKYSIQNFIQEIGKKWFKMSTWYKCSRKGKKLPSPSNWLFHCCHVNPYLGTRGTHITM